MTWSCKLVVINAQVQFGLFAISILAGRKQWWLKLEGGLKCIHTWMACTKNFGEHNGTSMQALWTRRMVVARQICNNEAHKTMSWKTLMLCCCFNLEIKWKVYKWEQWGLGTCIKLTLTSSQMILWFHQHPTWCCKTILIPSLIVKIPEWVLDSFHLIFD